jgi:hypothetical protein
MNRAPSIAIVIAALTCSAFSQTQYDTSPQGQTGIQSYGAYFKSDVDVVNSNTMNLTISIELFTLPGRELPLTFGLTYNSQNWESANCYGSPCATYTGGWRRTDGFNQPLSFFAEYVRCDYTGVNGGGIYGYQPLYNECLLD